MMNQRTIKKPVSVQGVGLHTGKPATITFKPAPVNHGYKFKRLDLEKEPVINSDVNRVSSTQRGTVLKQGEATVSTVEHALSALAGMRIDNVLMEIDGPEVPIADGSAAPFVAALTAAGIEQQSEARDYFEVQEPIFYKDAESGAEVIALPHDGFEVTTLIDFNSPVLGQQYAVFDLDTNYAEEIAPSRTFVFLHELEYLMSQNLIKGGNLDNAIVIVDQQVSQQQLDELALKLDKPSVKVEDDGVLNTVKLYFKNEPARHKLLDVIGDIALLGKPVKGRIMATKPGHRVNVEFTRLLKKKYQEQRKLRGKPALQPGRRTAIQHRTNCRKVTASLPFLAHR